MSAFASQAGMATRQSWSPDLSGHGPRASLFSVARTKAPQFLFETISAGGGRNANAVFGVCYTSQRRMSGAVLPKMAACASYPAEASAGDALGQPSLTPLVEPLLLPLID